MPNNIKVEIPQSRIGIKMINTKKGDTFTIKGVHVGDKFLRFTHAKGTKLPSETLVCNLYARKFKTERGEFNELSLYVLNAISIDGADVEKDENANDEIADDVDDADPDLPF